MHWILVQWARHRNGRFQTPTHPKHPNWRPWTTKDGPVSDIPVVGPLEIDYEALHLPGDPEMDSPRVPSSRRRHPSAEALKLLVSWNAETTIDARAATQPSHRPANPRR